MPDVAPSNNYLLGISKQAAEGTVGTVADYSMPVYSSAVKQAKDERIVQVTDASSVQGDTTYGPVSWGGSAEYPMLAASMGRWLQGAWTVDTISGAGPYVHTFSGLGNAPPWVSVFTSWPGAGSEQTRFSKGHVNEVSIIASADETPGRLRVGASGQTYDKIAWTATTADTLANGYFTLQATGASVKQDVDTPDVSPTVAATNWQSIELNVVSPMTPVPTVDGVTVTNISRGLIAPGGSGVMIWNDWDAYHASWYGSVAGTSASNVVVNGAILLTFKHTLQSSWLFTLYVPRVQFQTEAPEPDPSGGVLTLPVSFKINQPASGSHVQPVLTNAVSTAYSA